MTPVLMSFPIDAVWSATLTLPWVWPITHGSRLGPGTVRLSDHPYRPEDLGNSGGRVRRSKGNRRRASAVIQGEMQKHPTRFPQLLLYCAL